MPIAFEMPAWIVDLDGTLYHQPPLRLIMAAELLMFGQRKLPTIRAFRRQQELLRQASFDCDSPFELQIRETAAVLRVPADAVREAVHQWMITRPCRWLRAVRRRGLIRALARYLDRGGRTALVSDYPARDKLQALKVASLFQTVVANGERDGPRTLKPMPEGFLAAAGRLGVKPHDCLVIGDRDEVDGEAAKRAGMSYIHVRRLKGGRAIIQTSPLSTATRSLGSHHGCNL